MSHSSMLASRRNKQSIKKGLATAAKQQKKLRKANAANAVAGSGKKATA